jgi:hypothetical protein
MLEPEKKPTATPSATSLEAAPAPPNVVREPRSVAPNYFIAPLVYACAVGRGDVVLLDLRRNKYVGVGYRDALTLACCVREWPHPALSSNLAADTLAAGSNSADLTRSLVTAGLLCTTAASCHDVISSKVSLDGALVSIGDEIIGETDVRFQHVVLFIYYLLFSWVSLRLIPIHSVVRRVHRRRSKAIAARYVFSVPRASELVYIFRRIRPYLFLVRGHCLLHALTLVNFLAHFQEYPNWVFGVHTQPWRAHSWVQEGDFLLDSNPDSVCEFDPILAV